MPALNCEHARLASPSNELKRWDRNKLQATLGTRLDGLTTSPAGITRTPPRHVEAHPAPASADPYGMAAAIERMGRVIGRGMMPLAANQQRMDEAMALQRKKELGKRNSTITTSLSSRVGPTGLTSRTSRPSGAKPSRAMGGRRTRPTCSRRCGCGRRLWDTRSTHPSTRVKHTWNR